MSSIAERSSAINAWPTFGWSEPGQASAGQSSCPTCSRHVEVPLPVLVVQRAEPQGVQVKGTKSGRSRRVPVADRVLPLVRAGGALRK